MDIADKAPQPENERAVSESHRRDAPFSEIYELIFYNQTLVRSELEVLHHLIRNKLQQYATGEPNRDTALAHLAYKRQVVIGKLLKKD